MKPIDLAAATEGGLAPYTYTLYQAPSWLHVDAEGKLYGTPSATDTARTMTIRVTDAEGSYKEVNINVGRVYPNPADREVVSALTATATIPTPALGENVVQIDFEVPTDAPYRFAGGTDRGWYRKEGDTWVRYTATKFIEGTYRYQNLVLIDGGKGLTHRLDENVTLTVNGIPVTLEAVTVENASSSSRRYQFIQFLLRLHISCDTIKSGHTIMRIPYLQRIPRHGDTALHVIQHHVQRNAVPPARIRKIEHQHIIPLIISPSGHTLYLHLLFLHGIKHIE